MSFKYFKESEIAGLNRTLVQKLDLAREHAGIPFIITSGLRTLDLNAEVGGVADSSHLAGLAVDLLVKDSTARFLILKALIDQGFTRIGIYVTHIHTDIDTSKPQNVIWYD